MGWLNLISVLYVDDNGLTCHKVEEGAGYNLGSQLGGAGGHRDGLGI